jgi:predicted RNA-binding Zn-ribbon protein involved in translation (DUF1610 family)
MADSSPPNKRRSRLRRRAAPTGTALDFVHLDIPCPQCGQHGPQPLAELVANESVTCRSCGTVIDLTTEDWRTRLAEEAEKFKQIKRHP